MSSIHKFPPPDALYQLVGKSNFQLWLSAIKPYLFSNIESTGLILGGWTEPKATSKETEWDRARWLTANTETCRFIRGTLAINVIPHVRQHNTAKSLWHNLLWLYGEESGIDTQGGPPVPGSDNSRNHQGSSRTKLLAALAENGESIDLDLDVVAPKDPSPSRLPPVIRAFGSASSSKYHGTFLEVPSFERPEEEYDDEEDYDDEEYILDDSPQLSVLYNPPIPIVDSATKKTGPIPNDFNNGKGNETHTARVCIHERARVSPAASLETIHEEAHPGRRVDLTESSVFVGRRSIFSPHASRGRAIQQAPSLLEEIDDLDDFSEGTDSAGKKRTAVPFKRLFNPSKGDGSLRDKWSFSFPLRRLNGFMDKKEGERADIQEKGKGKGKAVHV